jgi:uncharacterized protein YciI
MDANDLMYQVIQRRAVERPYPAGMWMIELRFAPTPERLAARPAHRSRLTALHSEDVVRMAGPFADDSGAVILMEAPDRAAVDSFLTADLYFRTPGVTVVHIREWHPFLY